MQKRKSYQKRTEAREILELSEQTTLKEITLQYRRLFKRWYPDEKKFE
jgi:hypothetical protein